jgi:hypothetical protein
MLGERPIQLLFRRTDVTPHAGSESGTSLPAPTATTGDDGEIWNHPREGDELDDNDSLLEGYEDPDPLELENERIALGMGVDIEGHHDQRTQFDHELEDVGGINPNYMLLLLCLVTL